MTVTHTTPIATDLSDIYAMLAGWQTDRGAVQLHPGDIGWFSGKGAEATAAALRLWSINDKPAAIGLLDGPDVLRLGVDPAHASDATLGEAIAADIADPGHNVVPEGEASVEARAFPVLTSALKTRGWREGDRWTPFTWDLSQPVDDIAIRYEVIDANQLDAWCRIHWSAFRKSDPTDDELKRLIQRMTTILEGPFAKHSRAILGFDEADTPVAVAMVWCAGPGRPGLLEPMGVHQDHLRRGYGRAITRAAADTLRELGSSSILVCTEAARTPAITTYATSGFTQLPPVADLTRPGNE